MEKGKEKKETTMKDNEQENEKPRRNAELPHTAGGKENIKLVDCRASLKVNQPDRQDEQREDDDVQESFSLLGLIVQRYEGETCEDQFHGEGVACFEGGHIYKGKFSKGLMDGRGVFTGADGLKYEGEFVCNMPMGEGTYTWPDGSSYQGEVHSAIRHGTGTYKCAINDVSYTGQWDQGMRHGKGTVYYNQDKTSWYKGDWVRNNREGWGVRCYPSGNIYSGEWKNNLRHGEGTMRWLKLEQQYVGMWQNGVQHGRGTHVCVMRRADGSQYSQSNQYTGDFVHGQMHGQGTLYYASGAIYEEEGRGNKKHGKAKFTIEDGHVFEGEFVDDQMMTHDLNGNKAPTAQPGSSILSSDMALNIECLLEKIPERKRGTELQQVEFAVLRQAKELRSVYGFYSRLGHAHSPDNTFLLSRLQFWRLLKDCNIHHHGITLTQVEHFIRKDSTPAEIHSPFTSMLLHRLLSCLVIVAYHIYHKDMVSQNNLLAACFSKLMTDNILPDSKNVKGFLFRQPDRAAVAVIYLKKCWEVYRAYCKVNVTPREDQSMTCRHLLWMFKDLRLLDTNLTTPRLLQVITAESHDPSNLSACLDVEITFLEFFEVLLGSAEVKCQRVSEGLVEGQPLSSLGAEVRRDIPEVRIDEPEVKRDEPEVKRDIPEVKRDEPEVKRDAPELKRDAPEVKRNAPEVKRDAPELRRDAPEVKRDAPEVKRDAPEVKRDAPEVRRDAPELRRDAPELRRDAPEVKRNAPEDRRDAPEARRDAPEARRDALEVLAPVNSPITPDISSSKSVETMKSSDTAEASTAQDVVSQQDVKTEVTEKPHSAEQSEGKGVLTRGIEAKDCDVELWNQTIHLFFNQFFFPAFENNQLVSRKMEKLRQEAQRRIALAKAPMKSQVEGALGGGWMTRDAADKPDEASFSVPELSTQSKNKPMA